LARDSNAIHSPGPIFYAFFVALGNFTVLKVGSPVRQSLAVMPRALLLPHRLGLRFLYPEAGERVSRRFVPPDGQMGGRIPVNVLSGRHPVRFFPFPLPTGIFDQHPPGVFRGSFVCDSASSFFTLGLSSPFTSTTRPGHSFSARIGQKKDTSFFCLRHLAVFPGVFSFKVAGNSAMLFFSFR